MLPPYNLDTIQNLNTSSQYYHNQATASTDMRETALKEIARQFGMLAGLAEESRIINTRLKMHEQQLDNTFNFNQLMYKHLIVPPVIVQQTNQLKVSDDMQTIRAGGQMYQIVKQVYIASTPPTWRDYLYMSYQRPELPDRGVLPKTPSEQKVWANAVTQGWAQGIKQGLNIFTINMHKLSRDFNGMVLYKRLLAKNMVSPFYVKSKNLGITGNKDHVTIDDKSIHINNQPELQYRATTWKSVAIKNDK